MFRATFFVLVKWRTIQNIKSFKILLAIIVSIILGIGHGFLDGTRYVRRHTELQDVQRGAKMSFERARTYSQVIPIVFTIPDPQSLICGLNENSSGLGGKLLGVFGAPVIYNPYTLDNPFLYFSISEGYAGSIIILYSLFAFALTYQSASSDKNLNNIRMMLSFGVSRNQYIFSEWFSAIIGMMIPFIFGLLSFYLSLLAVSAPVIMTSIVLITFMLFNIATVSFFSLIGLWTSVVTSSSNASLTLSIVLWITTIWIIPSMAAKISQGALPVKFTYKEELISINDPNQKLINSLPTKPPPGIKNWSLSTLPNESPFYEGQPTLNINKRVEMGNQYNLYTLIGQVSPILSVKSGLSSVCGTGGDGVLRFISFCDKLNVNVSNWHRKHLSDDPQRGLIFTDNAPPLILDGLKPYYEFSPTEGSGSRSLLYFLPIMVMNIILIFGVMISFNKKSLILSK